jgi:hypothetical protein
MHNLARNSGKVKGQTRNLDERMVHGQRSGPGRFWVSDEYCYFAKCPNLGFEITEMLLGPLDLYPDKNESIVGG